MKVLAKVHARKEMGEVRPFNWLGQVGLRINGVVEESASEELGYEWKMRTSYEYEWNYLYENSKVQDLAVSEILSARLLRIEGGSKVIRLDG